MAPYFFTLPFSQTFVLFRLEVPCHPLSIYSDVPFTTLFSKRGQPAFSPWRLALISVMQFMENLSDRQAAEAVRSRIDWKYALSLPLADSGFHFSVFSEFRQRLIESDAEQLLLDKLLELLRDLGLLTQKRQRTDSTHILTAVRKLNRLETLGETFRSALNSLAAVAPEWLMNHLHSDWFDRYNRRVENYRLPKLDSEREALGNLIGKDGFALLNAIYAANSPSWLHQIPAVEILRQVWIQQFYSPSEDGSVQWRTTQDMPPSTQFRGWGEFANSVFARSAPFSIRCLRALATERCVVIVN